MHTSTVSPSPTLEPQIDRTADQANDAVARARRAHPSASSRFFSCDSTEEFLATLPYLTGYTDDNSLFVVLFRGARSCGTARFALPPGQSVAESLRVQDGVIAMLQASSLANERPVIVISTAQRFAGSATPPWLRFAKRLQRQLAKHGWQPREIAILAADGWCSLTSGHPSRPRPLTDISTCAAAERLRATRAAPKPLAEFGQLPTPSPHKLQVVAERLRELRARNEAEGGTGAEAPQTSNVPAPRAKDPRVWLPGTAQVAESCFSPDRAKGHVRGIDARLLARLIDAAQTPERWLVLALTSITRAEFVVGVAEEFGDDRFESVPFRVGAKARPGWTLIDILGLVADERPARGKIERTIAALSEAAAYAPEGYKPGVLALLGWAWWLHGMASVSGRFIDQALALDPANELARTVQTLTDAPAPAQLRHLCNTPPTTALAA